VFLERYISRAKHIEVQILGDQHGNVVHLHERDCSVQRRYQKVVEIAPSVELDPVVRKELCEAAVTLAKGIGYNNAGTVEFLYDMDQKDWFFIEMNPRIQVEHTVTECVTGIDLVRSQILVAKGFSLFSPEIAIPPQAEIPCNGYAIQCRITTEDPERGFAPDYGRILNYRSAAGFGIRLDAGSGDAGSVITPFYDSMLVKLTAMGRDFETACQRMDRALREFRIRGVKTNIPFLENVIRDETFRSGQAHTKLIDTKPELVKFKAKRDRATKLLSYLSDITVNGNTTAKGWKPDKPIPAPRIPHFQQSNINNRQSSIPRPAARSRPRKVQPVDPRAKAPAHHRHLDARRPPVAHRHPHAQPRHAAHRRPRRPPPAAALLASKCGAARPSTRRCAFLKECPGTASADLREKVPGILFQMLFRGSNAVGYSNYPDNVVAGFVKHSADAGMDIFRIFDSLNYLPNMRVAMEAVREHGKPLCEAAICYTGDILNRSATSIR
jgi:pyruvate carboxylase